MLICYQFQPHPSRCCLSCDICPGWTTITRNSPRVPSVVYFARLNAKTRGNSFPAFILLLKGQSGWKASLFANHDATVLTFRRCLWSMSIESGFGSRLFDEFRSKSRSGFVEKCENFLLEKFTFFENCNIFSSLASMTNFQAPAEEALSHLERTSTFSKQDASSFFEGHFSSLVSSLIRKNSSGSESYKTLILLDDCQLIFAPLTGRLWITWSGFMAAAWRLSKSADTTWKYQL